MYPSWDDIEQLLTPLDEHHRMMKPFNGSRYLVVTMHCIRMEVSCGQKPSFREVAGFMMLSNTPSTEQWPEIVSERKKMKKTTLNSPNKNSHNENGHSYCSQERCCTWG